MVYNVLLSKTAQKAYAKLTAKLQEGLDKCLAYLEVSPQFGPNIRGLKGNPGCYRYQVGGWRILYEVNEPAKEVRVYSIGPRGDVYKH